MHVVIDGVVIQPDLASGLADWLEAMPPKIGMTRISPPVVAKHHNIWCGIVILAESHISVHIDWNTNRCYVDAFSCKEFDPTILQQAISDIGLQSRRTTLIERGLEYLP